ncbi:MAG TPA: HEAT repeat domain-containing protein, partial [Ktedonobacterales bacterium]|nr:HEAT repeat domain-containing protein [Ktedonobacterales bacterium]
LAGLDHAAVAQTLWEAIQRGRAFVCLDSLDEVAPAQRPALIALINDLAAQSGNTWVVGSRFADYKGGQFAAGRFTEWELQPLDDALRLELARRLLPAFRRLFVLTPTAAHRRLSPTGFVNALAAHPRAAAWGENPLLFSLAAAVYAQTGALPQSRAALYAAVVDATLATRAPDLTDRASLRAMLAQVALRLHQTRGRAFSRDDLHAALVATCGKSSETDANVVRLIGSGALDVVAHETYGFRHHTFQEYLAAVALADGLASANEQARAAAWALAWSKRAYSRWAEILRLMVGALTHEHGAAGAEAALRWLRALADECATPEGDPGDLCLFLALASLGEAVDGGAEWQARVTEIADPLVRAWATLPTRETAYVPWLRERSWRTYIPDIRRLDPQITRYGLEALIQRLATVPPHNLRPLAEALGELGDHVPLAPLLACLGDSLPRVRLSALTVLTYMRERVPAATFVALLSDPEAQIRAQAADALGGYDDDASTQRLIDLLASEQIASVRVVAIQVLCEQAVRGFAPAVQALPDVLRNIEISSYPDNAVRGIEKLGESSLPAIRELLLALATTARHNTRAAALRGLAKWPDPPIALLIEVLSDPSNSVRGVALKALGDVLVRDTTGESVPVAPLIAALDDPDRFVVSAALETLGKLGTRAPLEPLIAFAQRSDHQHRQSVASAIAQRGNHEAFVALAALARNPNKDVRWMAAVALGKWHGRLDVSPLIAALYDPDAQVRCAATSALGNHPSRQGAEALLGVLTSTDKGVQTTINALGKHAAPLMDAPELADRVVDALIRALDNGSTNRVMTVEALSQLGEPGRRLSGEDMLARLTRPNNTARQTAIKVLGALRPMPIELLLLTSQQSSGWERLEALDQLANLGADAPQEVVDRLIAALDDEDKYVQSGAVSDLAQLGERAPVERLLALLGVSDKRSHTLTALISLGDRVPIEPLDRAFRQLLRERDSFKNYQAPQYEPLLLRLPWETLMVAAHHESRAMRVVAMRAIGKRDDSVVMQALRNATRDADAMTRAAALLALARRGEPIQPEALLTILAQHKGDEFTA